jgi:hypothetical protein
MIAAAAGGAFTIKEFCEAHRISTAYYYIMKAQGFGPREMRVGSRRIISFEAAADWRRQREAAAGPEIASPATGDGDDGAAPGSVTTKVD